MIGTGDVGHRRKRTVHSKCHQGLLLFRISGLAFEMGSLEHIRTEQLALSAPASSESGDAEATAAPMSSIRRQMWEVSTKRVADAIIAFVA